MSGEQQKRLSRRDLLGGAVVAGAAGLLGLRPRTVAAEPPPETTKLRLVQFLNDSPCIAPQYFAEELLHVEGFTDVQYIKTAPADVPKSLMRTTDMTMHTPSPLIVAIDAGMPIVMLAGVHVGCYELFATDRIRSVGELKGRSVAGGPMGSGRQMFLASMLAYVGLNPRKDVTWIPDEPAAAMQHLAEGKIDAFMSFPPEPQELRAKKIGHVLVNTMTDRPWSQYFCCNVAARREFIQKHPVATKRAMRAILKAADVCAQEPDRVARFVVGKGYTKRFDYTVQALKEIPYNKWRGYDSENSVRFHALRLYEVRIITSTPQKIITQGTDWRFLNELKKELKA